MMRAHSKTGTDLAAAERLLRMAQARFQEALETQTEAGSLQATVSIGVVSWDGVAEVDKNGLLKHSDDALYQAKEKGRNRVVLTLLRAGPK